MIRQEAIKHWYGALVLDINLGSKMLNNLPEEDLQNLWQPSSSAQIC